LDVCSPEPSICAKPCCRQLRIDLTENGTLRALRDYFRIVRDPGTIPRRAANRLQKDHIRVQSTVHPALSGLLGGGSADGWAEGVLLRLSKHLSRTI
jgi:hypothetical protein